MAYLRHSMEYAKSYQVYLVPGPFILKDRLCLCLISPQGKPLAIQKATHLNLLHHASLGTDDTLQVISTGLGKLALLCDVDIFHPEVARSAVMQGAEVLISVQYYDLYDLNELRVRSGSWEMAQENQVPVINVSNQNCCIAAPCSVTQDHSGYILPPQTSFPALATVYPHKTQKLREEKDLLSYLNPEFCARYFPQLNR